ncbi:MAG: MBOAT family O-acyltransferase [Pricia sp.]
MSYLIDIYYQRVNPQKNLISLALYISMFPQLIAGPIVRYIDISKQIDAFRPFKILQFQQGIKRFITGLFKKVIIANQMGFLADVVFSNTSDLGAVSHWVGIICYAFQIYFDFSGYSDMAIGLGKMFGFDFLENFDHPYISESIQEFWRRWHISLSSWFRDYLYIPLGGNRKGVSRTYVNLIIVFFITGLWHGASWNFIVWGLYHGLFLILEKLWLGHMLTKKKFLGHIYALLVILVGWVFFRAETLTDAMRYIKRMFSFIFAENQMVYQYFDLYFVFITVLAILFSTNFKKRLKERISSSKTTTKPMLVGSYLLYLGLFLACVFELAESNYNPFIYFRF